MESQKQNPLLEVGCDYITVTAASSGARKNLVEFGKYLVRDAVRRGAKQTVCRTLGYKGESTEGVSWGQRTDGALLRTTSHKAAEHWNQIYDMSEHCTRFDVQLTLRTQQTPHEIMSAIWKRNPGWTTGEGRKSKVKKVVGPSGIESMFVGSRQSDRFFRIYDKGIESGEWRYRMAVRWEIEFKGDCSQSFAEQLTKVENPEAAMIATISAFCSRRLRVRQIAGFLRSSAGNEIMCGRSSESAQVCNKELRWLYHSVRPCVERLLAAGQYERVLTALGLLTDDGPSEKLNPGPNGPKAKKEDST